MSASVPGALPAEPAPWPLHFFQEPLRLPQQPVSSLASSAQAFLLLHIFLSLSRSLSVCVHALSGVWYFGLQSLVTRDIIQVFHMFRRHLGNFLRNVYSRGRRTVKRVYCSSRGLEFDSWNAYQVAYKCCNSSSRGSITLFWPPAASVPICI